MLRHGFGPAPLVMGLILGQLVEESLSQSMIMFDNNWFQFFDSPIVVMFFVLTVLGLFWSQFLRGVKAIAGRIRGTRMERGD